MLSTKAGSLVGIAELIGCDADVTWAECCVEKQDDGAVTTLGRTASETEATTYDWVPLIVWRNTE